jgi:7-cyano-7-deazaguanine synthase
MNDKKCLIVLSGGQDSTTVLYMAKHYFKEVHAITFDYGQRHSREIHAAKAIGEMAGVASHEIIRVLDCLVSVSPLTSNTLLEQYTDAAQMAEVIGDRVELTFVPMRNALFLTIAANRAVALGCQLIAIGVCEEDNANYPDCRACFIDITETFINVALGNDRDEDNWIELYAPLLNSTKADSVLRAKDLPGCWDALAHSHTSYDGKFPPTDMNHANVLRAAGFEEADLPDPLVLRAVKEGLMELPLTENYRKELIQ